MIVAEVLVLLALLSVILWFFGVEGGAILGVWWSAGASLAAITLFAYLVAWMLKNWFHVCGC